MSQLRKGHVYFRLLPLPLNKIIPPGVSILPLTLRSTDRAVAALVVGGCPWYDYRPPGVSQHGTRGRGSSSSSKSSRGSHTAPVSVHSRPRRYDAHTWQLPPCPPSDVARTVGSPGASSVATPSTASSSSNADIACYAWSWSLSLSLS